jgi:hypothetical protein
MKKIAVASALMIFVRLTNANPDHPVKHAKRSSMGGAFIGA